ncbi:MAG: helix-turn-helix transcriptional regulator [Kiloniellales bacterium]
MSVSVFRETEALGPETVSHPRAKMFSQEEWCCFANTETQRLQVVTAYLGRTRLCRVRSTGHSIGLVEKECLTVLIPRRGRLRVQTRHGHYQAEPGHTLVFGPNERTTTVIPDHSGRFDADCLLLPVADPDRTANNDCSRKVNTATELAFRSCNASRQDAALRDYAAALFQAAHAGSSIFRSPSAANASTTLLTELLNDLIESPQENDKATGVAGKAERRLVEAAEDFMQARLETALSVKDLAATLQVSTRRLQQAFRALREASPKTVLNELRLNEAHRRLRDPKAHDTVGSIAYSCGFGHLGRFSAAYRARFGEAPSATLKAS